MKRGNKTIFSLVLTFMLCAFVFNIAIAYSSQNKNSYIKFLDDIERQTRQSLVIIEYVLEKDGGQDNRSSRNSGVNIFIPEKNTDPAEAKSKKDPFKNFKDGNNQKKSPRELLEDLNRKYLDDNNPDIKNDEEYPAQKWPIFKFCGFGVLTGKNTVYIIKNMREFMNDVRYYKKKYNTKNISFRAVDMDGNIYKTELASQNKTKKVVVFKIHKTNSLRPVIFLKNPQVRLGKKLYLFGIMQSEKSWMSYYDRSKSSKDKSDESRYSPLFLTCEINAYEEKWFISYGARSIERTFGAIVFNSEGKPIAFMNHWGQLTFTLTK